MLTASGIGTKQCRRIQPTSPSTLPPDRGPGQALVVALARAPEPIREQIVRLQLAEHPRPLPRPVTQDPDYGKPGVVVQDRLRHLAEERDRRSVASAEGLRRLRRIGRYEDGVAVRQVHREEVDLLFHPADLRQRLAEVGLGRSRLMAQRHEHLPLPQPALVHVLLHHRQPASVAVLIPKPFEDPLRGVPLLRRTAMVVLKDPVDHANKRVQLRPHRWPRPPVPWRYREHQHLGYRPRVDAKPPTRLAVAQSLDLDRMTDPTIKLHALHPSAPRQTGQGDYQLPEFCSGAAGQSGRFTEGVCRRRLQAWLAMRRVTVSVHGVRLASRQRGRRLSLDEEGRPMMKRLAVAVALTLALGGAVQAQGACAPGQLDQGRVAFWANRLAEAVSLWRPCAEQGLADAQYNLGLMYQNGHGVPQDDAEAARWYRLAAEQGYADAQLNLGVMYENGLGVLQDYAEALRWYRLAAEQGLALAQANLGLMYDLGLSVLQDDAEALRWYRLAAEQGFADAQYNLGLAYNDGRGVPQDYVLAHMWFNIAAANGLTGAGDERDILGRSMTPQQIAEAQRLAREWIAAHPR